MKHIVEVLPPPLIKNEGNRKRLHKCDSEAQDWLHSLKAFRTGNVFGITTFVILKVLFYHILLFIYHFYI